MNVLKSKRKSSRAARAGELSQATQDKLAELSARVAAMRAELATPPSRPRAAAVKLARDLPAPLSPPLKPGAAVKAAQRLNRASGMLAASVLLDSAVEHYRGQFENRAMYTPLVVATLALAASAHGHSDRLVRNHRVRDGIFLLSALTGIVGSGFHVYNVMKRPGGLSWQNLFYGSPLGAPMALVLSGLHGAAAERVRNNSPLTLPRIFGLPAGRTLASLTSLGLLGSSAEAALLHLRGAYHDPFMVAPVTIPPAAAVLLANTAFGPAPRGRRFTRWWLRLTAAIGFVGVGFHVWGVQRNMGGWRNWRQNLLNGPPIPAPPSFTGLALAGLAALGLLEDHPDA